MLKDIGILKELYKKLLKNVENMEEDLYTFFPQVGDNYFVAENKILFIGKAVNGWVTKERNLNILFSKENTERIVNRDDQMEWVRNCEGSKEYNTKRSAFWRVIKNISKELNQSEEWTKNIAWSNLYKISFEKGNPDSNLQKLQRSVCKEILEEEIKILKPDVIIFFTSGWEKFLLEDQKNSKKQILNWGSKFKTEYYEKNGIKYFLSQHPQGKSEKEHSRVIIDKIKE